MIDVHCIGVRSKSKLTQEVLECAEKLVAVGCFCIGTDQTDLDFAAKKGVPVFNSPFSNTRSVAELVIAEIIMLARQAAQRNLELQTTGRWNKRSKGCYEVRGKTLGIIGYGHVGSQLSIIAESLGMQVQYYDIIPKLPLGNAKSLESLDELLKTSDFVSLHVPGDETTYKMINKEKINLMRKGTYLVNASRGKVVEVDDLAEALHSGHLAGAAVDVFPVEPLPGILLFHFRKIFK